MENTQKTDQENLRGPVVAWNLDRTLYRLYDTFEDAKREFPCLLTYRMLPCTINSKKLGWLEDLDPVDKLRIVAIDSARNSYK